MLGGLLGKNNGPKRGNSSAAAPPQKRLLNVEIVSAKNLIACNKNTSDPFATVALTDLGGREIKTESFKTKQKSNTIAPEWNEKFSFGNSYNLDTEGILPSVLINFFHKGQFAVSEVPMGTVTIHLDTIDPNGGITEKWYTLEVTGRMKVVSGDVLVRCNFNCPPTKAEPDEEEQVEEIEGADEEPPNELHITIVSGRNLPIMDKNLFSSGGSSDPQVRVKVGESDQKKTNFVRKNVNPVWNETLVFPHVTDPGTPVKITVEDHNDIKPVCDFMGRTTINLQEFDDKKAQKRVLKLKNKMMDTDGIDRGEIEIKVHWKFNVKVKEEARQKQMAYEASTLGKITALGNKLGRAVGAISDSESEADDEENDQNKEAEAERPMTEEEKEKAKKEEEEKVKALSDIEIKDGDYQIQVHIIEARDLKAENFDGTSDPIVYVECFDQKQNTIVVKGVTSCVFDELFIFNFKAMDKERFEEGVIRIACYDSNINPLASNTMIGAYAFDATMVYNLNKDHEMYRKWVPLMDDEDPEDVGVQGYLKISVQIVGPGEKIKVHDEDAERAKEIQQESAAGGDIGSLVMTTPTIRKEWQYVVVSIYKCEGLPVMDGKIGMSIATVKKAGTDAFCKLNFGGGKSIKTKVVTVSGDNRTMINPTFNYELWYPVSIPTMTQMIKFSVWDEDPTESELIGNIVEKYNVIDRTPRRSTDLRWYNMYGCPEFKQEKLLANIKKGATEVAKRAKQAIGKDIDWSEYYNNVPDKASTYKGRALMKFRIEKKRPDKYDKPEVKPFKRRLKPLLSKQEPPSTEYVLRALVVSGTELPSFGTIANQKLTVKVAIGVHELSTRPAKFENGQCRWNELLKTEKIKLPTALDQLPDIFIYLVREDLKPVCFTRIKSVANLKEGTLIGFDRPAEWFLLQEDKSIDALSADVFPGNVLIKLGFGTAVESERVENHWRECESMSKKGSPYQVRVHVYQAKDIPAADSNGLADPYIKVTFMGQQQKTDPVRKSLFPSYYKSFVFDEVMIPEYENYQYASQVSFRLFDHDDLDAHDYLGCCMVNITDAIITPDPDAELPDPKWHEFFREVPKDGQGQLLCQVQIIPTAGKTLSKIPRSIIPPTRKAFIEFIVIGVRDLAPFNFQAMQAPFLDIELTSFGSTYTASTKTSKKPNPANPNFLDKILMPVLLPEKSIYSSPLQVRARDTRLGGYMKPIVGVCQIDMYHKIPWCPETYKPPQTDMFHQSADDRGVPSSNPGMAGVLPGSNNDEIALELQEMQNKRTSELIGDDYIVSQEPVSVDKYVKGRVAIDDTGAGVFGALNHISMDGAIKKKRTGEDAFTDPDWTEDDSEQPPAWSVNRKKLAEELEVEFKTTPFETYSLTRGQVNGFFGSTLKVVGKLKGLVRVIENENEPPLLSKELMEQLLSPKKYKIRLYALRGVGLAAMDFDMWGKPAKSDPYLRVTLGKEVYDDRENAVEDVTEVDLYKMIEFDAELPGTSQLRIELMDKDTIGSDDLIGRTTVDLEDRWFDSRWQKWGEENMMVPGSDPKDKTKCRWHTKPVERRSLYAPKQTAPQGVLECWVDIMRPEIASTFPPDDVALPPTKMYEVRVVIWKTKNVPPMDTLEGMSDLYVKCWPEGCKPQETDTHWRCKKGKASFNWRILFDVELGHNTRAMKFPYFHLQLWDRDLLKWNDCAGEGVIDLGKYFRKAYKRDVALKLFETKKGAAAKRASKKDKKQRGAVEDTGEDIPPEEEEVKEGDETTIQDDVVSPLIAQPSQNPNLAILPPRDEPDSDDDDDEGMGAIPLNAGNKPKTPEKPKTPTKAAEKPKPKSKFPPKKKLPTPPPANAGYFSWLMFWRSAKKSADEHVDAEGKPLLDGKDGDGKDKEAPEKSEEEKKDDEKKEARELVNMIKNLTGLWDVDPEDSAWFHLENRDKNDPTKVTPMGSICYSIQIWPKDKATVMAVGAARSEPNTNPFLPPPVGRLKWSWNPFVLGSELCGPALCAQLFCCLLCAAFIVMMIFCQPFLNIIINLIFVVY